MYLASQTIGRALALIACLLMFLSTSMSAEEIQVFDIGADAASKTLKSFSRQAKVSILYSPKAVRGIRTNEVKGLMNPSVALGLMLKGTELAFVGDGETGAFAVKRSDPSAVAGPRNQTLVPMTKPQTEKDPSSRSKRMLATALTAAISAAASPVSAQDDNEEDIFSLSPFVVEASEDEGWRSNSTLAGTRFKTPTRDLAASIEVYTKEFLEDNAINNLSDAALYASNAEGSLEYTDVADGVDFDNEGQLTKPGNQTRVRGLRAPDNTRNYFTVASPIDTYNMGRLTYSRGPNSILFGLGSPTGIVESSPLRANYEDGGTIDVAFDNLGSHRFAFSYNKVLWEDKLAVVIAGLRDSEETIFHPTYDRDDRFYGAIGFDPFEGTRIDISYEEIDVDASRSRTWYIPDHLTAWIDAGRPSYDPLTREYKVDGVVTPEASSGARTIPYDEVVIFSNADGSLASPIGFTRNGEFDGDGTGDGTLESSTAQLRRSAGLLENSGGLGFGANTKTSLLDNSVFPVFYNSQNSVFADDEANILDISLSQRILKDLYVELAYHNENYHQLFLSQGRGAEAAPFIDINEVLLNGEPNPNFGRLAILSEPWGQVESIDTEVARATASYTFDFTEKTDGWARWLGRHQIALMGEKNETEILRDRIVELVVNDPTIDGVPLYENKVTGGRRIRRVIYIDDPARPGEVAGLQKQVRPDLLSSTWSGLLAPAPDGSWVPFDGDVVTRFELGNGATAHFRELDSGLGVIQSSLLEGHLVFSVGYREDTTTRFSNNVPRDPETGLVTLPTSVEIGEEFEDYSFKTNTRTRGVVAHGAGPLSFLSAHYQESSNFNPQPLRSITGRVLDAQIGDGKDYGFSMSLLENKLRVKVNWFENELQNVNNISVELIARWRINGFEANIANFFNSGLVNDVEWRKNIIEENGLTYQFPTAFTGHMGNRWNGELNLPALGTESDPTRNVAFLEAIGYTGPTAQFAKSLSNDTRSFTDLTSEGIEIDVEYQITDNWFLKANASQTESINSNVGTDVLDYLDSRAALYESLFPHTQRLSDGRTWEEFYANRLILERAELAKDLEGLPNPQIREYRVNVNTRYAFNEGRFDGLTIGGATRWRSAPSIGFLSALNPVTEKPKFDATRPIEGDETLEFDAFASYKFKELFGKNIDMTLRLNIRNLFDNRDPVAQEAVDRIPADEIGSSPPIPVVTRYAPTLPREFILSAKFEF